MTTVVWIAYYSDRSGFALFADELSALRYAVANSLEVAALTLPCEDVWKALGV